MPIAPDDICLNKAAIIERALSRVIEERKADPDMKSNTRMDAMTLNIERACQGAIDLAMHLAARERLGMPQSAADAFGLLQRSGLISETSCRAMNAMVGFRNIAIHEYQQLDNAVLAHIADQGWKTLVDFGRELGLKIEPKV